MYHNSECPGRFAIQPAVRDYYQHRVNNDNGDHFRDAWRSDPLRGVDDHSVDESRGSHAIGEPPNLIHRNRDDEEIRHNS